MPYRPEFGGIWVRIDGVWWQCCLMYGKTLASYEDYEIYTYVVPWK